MQHVAFCRLAIVAGLCLLAGCVRKSADGNANVYEMESWAGPVVLSVGLALFVFGYYLFRTNWWKGLLALLAGAFIAVGAAPGLFLDRLVVDDEHFHLRTGFWFAPTEHDVRFADLSRIDYTVTERMTKRGKKFDYDLVCHFRGAGDTRRVPVGTLMEEARIDIFARAIARKVPINDLTAK